MSELPGGYEIGWNEDMRFPCWWWEAGDGTEHATKEEAVAAALAHANKQRAIGIRMAAEHFEMSPYNDDACVAGELREFADKLEKRGDNAK